MRKIVCNQCALDWQVQHCCKNGVSTASPTAIYEPDPPASILYRADLKAKLALAKEALEFYAEPFTYGRIIADVRADVSVGGLVSMYGTKAREALEKLK